MKLNSCIQIMSSRTRCLPFCINSISKLANPEKYPIYVHYFDDIYDNVIRRIATAGFISNVKFSSVPYKTPAFLSESELFYNRTNFEYVRNSFSRNRKGYLHMCHFIINIYKYENTNIHSHDYVRFYDDESGYLTKIEDDPSHLLHAKGLEFGALFYGQRLKDGAPHAGHLATRHKLYDFLVWYMETNNIKPKSKKMAKMLRHSDPEAAFHMLPWADSYVIRTSMYESDAWNKWITAVNKSGGVYKYRWGDNEIYTLFALMNYEYGIYNFDWISSQIHHQSKYRRMQDIAPSIKNFDL